MNNQILNTLPIAQITLNFNESIFVNLNGEFQKVEKIFYERNKTYDVMSVLEDGTFELADGRFLRNLPPHHYELTYGYLKIVGEQVPVYSPNGHFLRYVSNGQKFKVYDIKVDPISNISRYYIGKSNEIITSNSAVIFMKGYYIPAKEYVIPSETSIVLEENVQQVVTAVKDNKIQLALAPNFWWDLSIYKGTLKSFAL